MKPAAPWLLAAGVLAAEPAQASDVYALVVGADTYVGLKALGGAVNDARLLANALSAVGAQEVVTLTDAEATRAQIFSAFENLAVKAKAGDWLVLTYAGHGGQERESLAGDESDGLDEVMLLPGYLDQAPQNGERIRDNDIYALFAAVRPEVTILFVADACHSGTMTRSIDPRARNLTSRFADYGPINDTLAPPPATSAGHDVRELPNVVFAAASLDTEATPELMLEGRLHGALSVQVAKAIRGAADLDHNGRIDLSEFRRYVVSATRLASESRQTPDVRFLASRGNDALFFGRPAAPVEQPPEPVLTVNAGGAPLPPSVPSASGGEGDFVWDRLTGSVVSNATGDLVATALDSAALSTTIEKWRVLPRLKALAAQSALALDIAPRGAGARYRNGETAQIVIQPRDDFGSGHLTVISLAGDGTVQWLFPSSRQAGEAEAVSFTERRSFEVRAGPPFGADHVVAIATEAPHDDLRQQLRSIEGQRAPGAAAAAIDQAVSSTRYALGLVGLYTGGQ